MFDRKKLVFAFLGLFLIIGGLGLGLFALGRQIVFRNQAASDTGTATLSVTPAKNNLTVGEIIPVYVEFDTVGASTGVSIVQLALSYPYSGDTPELDIVDSTGKQINQLSLNPNITYGGKWSTSINNVTRATGKVTLQISVTYNDVTGYTSADKINLATFYLKANRVGGPVDFTFDTANSMILTKTSPTQDILKTPLPVSLTISGETSTGVGQLKFISPMTTISVGQSVALEVKMNTGGVAISSLSFKISYPYSGTTPELDVVSLVPVVSSDWAFPVKSINRANNLVTIDFAAINSNIAGFSSATDTTIATITFKANRQPTTNPITLTFDPSQTTMLSKASPPAAILQMPSSFSYTLNSADTNPPVVTITSPTTSVVGGTVPITVEVTDDTGISKVEFRLNGNLISTDTQSPYSYSWDTLSLDGNYTWEISAYDTFNNQGVTSALMVVNNVSNLTFGFKVQGVEGAGITKNFTVIIKGATTLTSLPTSLTSGTGGVFKTSLPVSLSEPTVDISIKSDGLLTKKLGSISLTPGPVTAPTSWESSSVIVGDFDGNNILNITDIAKMLQNYTAITTPVTSTNGLNLYDVDGDGNYALKDIANVLGNYTALTINGD